jgi:hypothetical protein
VRSRKLWARPTDARPWRSCASCFAPEAVESRLACLSFWEQALRNEDLLEAKITQDHDWHYRLEVSWVP